MPPPADAEAAGFQALQPLSAERAPPARPDSRSPSAESSLGSVLVAASDRGVCAILLGDDPAALERELRQRFPRASLGRTTPPSSAP